MKKTLNEEVSRIKQVMGMVINERSNIEYLIEAIAIQVQDKLLANGVLAKLNDKYGFTIEIDGYPRKQITYSDNGEMIIQKTIEKIEILFQLNKRSEEHEPILQILIYYIGQLQPRNSSHIFNIEDGIDFILKLKEERKIPIID